MSRAWSWGLSGIWMAALFWDIIPWSWGSAALAFFVCIFLAGMLHYGEDALCRPPGFAACTGWLVFLLFQFLPLPPAVLSFLSPGAYRLYSESIWVVKPGAWMPLALVAQPLFLGVMQFWTLVGVFFVTTSAGSDHIGLGKLIRRLVIGAGVLAMGTIFLFIFQTFDQASWEISPGIAVVFAALMPLALACHLYTKPHQNYGKWSARLKQALRHPSGYLHGYLLTSAFIMGVAVVLMGTFLLQIALAGGLMLMTAMYLLHRGSRSSCMSAVVFSLVLLVVVGLGSRFDQHSSSLSVSAPVPMSLDARSLVKDFLPLGAGPGNLSDLKMRYSHLSESISENNSFERTLVFLSEGGLIGFILTMWFWAAVFIAGIHGWRKRRNRMAMFLLPGIFGGFIVCFVSGPDPYRPFVLWPGLSGYFLAGLLIAIACFSSTGDADASIGRLRSSERWSMIFLSGAFALMGVIYVGGKIAAVPFQTDSTVIDFEELAVQSADFSSEIEKYVTFDPLSGANWYAAGRYWFEQKQEEKALTCSQRALGLNPLAGESIYRLGMLLDRRGQVVEGEKLMLTGLKNAPFSNRLHRDYLLYLLTKGEEGKALKTLSELLLLAPEQTGFWLRYFENQDLSEIRWSDYLPRRAEVYWQYGEYLAMRREGRTADEIFKKAVKLAVSEPWVSADLFLNIAGYFMTGNRLEVALDVLRAGMEARPADVALLLTAGGVYQRLGIVYRAEELYRKALLLDPDNEEVRARLDAI